MFEYHSSTEPNHNDSSRQHQHKSSDVATAAPTSSQSTASPPKLNTFAGNKTKTTSRKPSAPISSSAEAPPNGNSGSKKPPAVVAAVCNANLTQFALETYFIWFSVLIFITELLVDVLLVLLYFYRGRYVWSLTTAGLVVLPLGLCQVYSYWLLRTDIGAAARPMPAVAAAMHWLLLGIPYRYHAILRRVDRDKVAAMHRTTMGGGCGGGESAGGVGGSTMAIRHQISDVSAVQTMNATFQYCPQFLFQSFLIVYREYKCILTGVSAGLAGFSFVWHIFIHFYYLVKRYHETDQYDAGECFDRSAAATDATNRSRNGSSISSAAHIIINPSSTPSATLPSPPFIIDNIMSSSTTSNITRAIQPESAPLSATSSQQPNNHSTATVNNHNAASGPSSLISQHNVSITSAASSCQSSADRLRNFEKTQYTTDDNNLMSKRTTGSKMVEKCKIFGINNKRRPIYQAQASASSATFGEEFELNESCGGVGGGAANNASTVFFEIDDSFVSDGHPNETATCGSFGNQQRQRQQHANDDGMFNVSLINESNANEEHNVGHGNGGSSVQLVRKTMNDYMYKFTACAAGATSSLMMLCGDDAPSATTGEKYGGEYGERLLTGGGGGSSVWTARQPHQQQHQQHQHQRHNFGDGLGPLLPSDELFAAVDFCGQQHQQQHRIKRKGICSSQEMLHLVDLMNDHITAEQVDELAKSLVELDGGDSSLMSSLTPSKSSTTQTSLLGGGIGGGAVGSGDCDASLLDQSKLLMLENFPQHCDDRRLLENIDAAIYENQIIFQERIRKNQLTIQNLKLQDQLLSKCLEDMKTRGSAASLVAAAAAAASAAAAAAAAASTANGSTIGGGGAQNASEILSVRDYENMCFTNIARTDRGMKHWRNYFQDMDGSAHDGSTVQHSSYYVNTNTMSGSMTELYINEDGVGAKNGTQVSGANGSRNPGDGDDDDGGASTVIIHDDVDDEDGTEKDDGDSNSQVSNDGLLERRFVVKKKAIRRSWNRQLTGDDSGRQRLTMLMMPPPPPPLVQLSNNMLATTTTANGLTGMLMMDTTSTTTAAMRGGGSNNSSVVVEMDDESDGVGRVVAGVEQRNDDDEDCGGSVAAELSQKNQLVETINKINVDSPVKSLLKNGRGNGDC